MNGLPMADSAPMTGVSVQTGCYIDGSHIRSDDFSVAVIDLAIDRGFEIDMDVYKEDIGHLHDDTYDSDDLFIIQEALEWTYQGAIDFLNDTAPDYLIWFVEDQSLFLEESED